MTLAEKGPIQTAPTLAPPILENLSLAVQSWPGVAAYVHWDLYRVGEKIDGVDFYVDGDEQELGHLHLDGDLHLPAPPALAKALLQARLATPLPFGAGWVGWRVRTPADAAHAEWLLQLNYDWLRGTPLAALLARISARSGR